MHTNTSQRRDVRCLGDVRGSFQDRRHPSVRKVRFYPVKFRVVLDKEVAVSGRTCDRQLRCSLSVPLGRKAACLLMETDEAELWR